MNVALKKTELLKAHIPTPRGMVFYPSIESIWSDANLIGYWSVIKRAWREMKLNGVLCLDNRPILYLKEYGRPFSVQERIFHQKLFWNQGVANVLVLADPTAIYIYSGLAKPREDMIDEEAKEYALVERLQQVDYVQRIQSFYHELATGYYYEINRNFFNPKHSVDSWLLDNLRALRNVLINGDDKLETKDAHAFIGRVLFLCYLLDRGIVSISNLVPGFTGTMMLAELLEKSPYAYRVDYLYTLFGDLKERFNGNMFDQDVETEKRLIKDSHLDKLTLFLGGHSVESGQLSLGFWPYDFKMIPVETISAIYQDFLSAEDKESQRRRGAFYTPRFLAEMVVDIAINDDPEAFGWSFLDATCGSGIFLVILFNRLANQWIHAQGSRIQYRDKAEALQAILADQICGIDFEETACRIACFSLYLAYLDFFDPPDIKEYMERTGQPLPKLLDYGDEPNRPKAEIPVIHKADSLEGENLSEKTFDCIIGNPPWEGRQSKQLAQKFLQIAPSYLKQSGIGCLLLPTKILQNQTDTFQSKWLQQITLEKVLQLADYRHLLFQNAKTPAFIGRFRNKVPQITRDKVEFAAPKFNRDGLRQGIITVNPSTRSWLALSKVIEATRQEKAPVVWKRHLWGTHRDQKFLDLLQSMPSLKAHVDVLSELRVRRLKRTKSWVAGDGIKPWPQSKIKSDRPPKKLRWSLKMPFIETTPWRSDLILFLEDTIPLKKRLIKKRYRTDVLYSQPPQNIFQYPMVLISRGFDKVTYCEFDVLFQHSLRSITGPHEDINLLMFLTAYLRSKLSRYFLFHTTSSWGTERDQVNLNELLRLPFPLPGNDYVSKEAGQIVKLVAEKMQKLRNELQKNLDLLKSDYKRHSLNDDHGEMNRQWYNKRKKRVDTLQEEFDKLIYQYFELTDQEIALVEDTVRIFEPSSTPTTWRSEQTVTLDQTEMTKVEPYSGNGLAKYADTLTLTLNSWAQSEGSHFRVRAEGGIDNQTGLAMISLYISNTESTYSQKSFSGRLAEISNSIYKNTSRRKRTLLYERDIFLFQGDRICIIRPNILLNWTRTAAFNDAARIYGEIALKQRESQG